MTEAATVAVPEKLYQEVCSQAARVDEARSTYNVANERAKGAKKYLEAAQETLESLIRRFTAPESDLPLFQNQSDAIAAAQADPVVTKLVERLLARGHDVNAVIVFGYTEDERNQVAKYLDVMDENDAARAKAEGTDETATIVDVEVPGFLVPEPLTPIEVADLIGRLDACGHTVDADEVEAWKLTQLSDIRAWLSAVEAVKAEKGEAVVFDDLPPAPEWLVEGDEGDDELHDADPAGAENELASAEA
jgi:hypothetical protein